MRLEAKIRSIRLPRTLDLVAAPALFEMLMSARGRAVCIESSQVERVDSQCLQILLSARSTWRSDGHVLEFRNPSLEFVAGLEFLGVRAKSLLGKELSQ